MESQYLAQGPCSWSNLKNFDPLIVLSWLSHLGPWLLHLQAAQGALCPSALFPTISLPRRQNTLCWTQTHTLTRAVGRPSAAMLELSVVFRDSQS